VICLSMLNTIGHNKSREVTSDSWRCRSHLRSTLGRRMRFKYYVWFALGWFTFMIVLDGIYIFIHGPGRTGPLANAILAAIMGGFVMGPIG
jgi:hypothetical protein